MKNYYRILLLAIVWLVGTTSLEASEFIGTSESTKTVKAGNAAGCTAASGFQMLDVNNVRGRVKPVVTYGGMLEEVLVICIIFLQIVPKLPCLPGGSLDRRSRC